MFSSIRMRLTLWHLLTTGVLLFSFCLFSYVLLSRNMYGRLDDALYFQCSDKAADFHDELKESKSSPATTASLLLASNPSYGFFTVLVLENDVIAADLSKNQLEAIKKGLDHFSTNEKKQYIFAAHAFGEDGAHVAVTSFEMKGGHYRVLSIKPLHDVMEHLEVLRSVYYFCVPLALVLIALGGYFLAGKSLEPVVKMSEKARNIGAATLHERLDIRNENDELGKLALVFNEMLERIDDAFRSMTSFMSDASHEMRTPVAIIQGESEVALSKPRSADEYGESLSIIHDEAKRLSSIVNDLLTLSRADTGQRQITVKEFYMNDLVDECFRAAKTLAVKKNITVTVENTDDVPMSGDEYLLKQLIMNLLDNAIRYTPENGAVSLSLACGNENVKVTVADNGIGISAEETKKVFERFYRVDKARSRAEGGSGLGLAIADVIAKAHGGSIELEGRPGHGSAFTVILPRKPGQTDSRQTWE